MLMTFVSKLLFLGQKRIIMIYQVGGLASLELS